MIVERELIKEAKEKLGDKNAFLMADLLNLQDFDEKNLKALCPYHDEKTPSFVYNRKGYYFKCFGCSKTVDIIDVLMEKGYTFLDAAGFLFEKAGIEYSFGEQYIKTRRDYRYPHEEPLGDKDQVIEYFGKRGISKNVLDYLDVRQDAKGNAVFNFYDENDVLTMVKYRPSHTVDKKAGQSKTWCQTGADTSPILFNMNRINTSNPLLITEGEADTMSAIEAGYLNTVSVPLGAGNLHWIDENWDWLDQFDSIIIWADNDAPGEKMRKECIHRLGTWKTKYIETPLFYEKEDKKKIPLKDINDCLQVGGKEYVMKLIADAKDIPVTSVVDYADIEEEDINDMDGVETGISAIDDILIKLFYGTLTVLSGRPGSGKTSLIDQTIANTIDNGEPVFLFSKEMPERMSTNWFNTVIAGRRNLQEFTNKAGGQFYKTSKQTRDAMQGYYRDYLYIYKDSEPNGVEDVLASAEASVRKYGCKLVVLDNLMMLDLKCNEENMNVAQTSLINTLIKFAAKFNVAVVLIAHPRKTQSDDSDIGLYDIAGSSNIINLAMRSIGMRKVSDEEKENPRSKWRKYDVVLTIMKDRMLGFSGKKIGLWYDKVSRRFYSNYKEYDKQFAWDKNYYPEKLPYVDRLRANPDDIFPDK